MIWYNVPGSCLIEKIIDVLSHLKNEITIDENIRERALKPLNRMLEVV